MGQLFSYAQPATERACRDFMFIAKRKSIAEHKANKISVNCGLILSRRKFLKYENVGMTMILDSRKNSTKWIVYLNSLY